MKKFISILLLIATLLSCFMIACDKVSLPEDDDLDNEPEIEEELPEEPEPEHPNEYVCIRGAEDVVYEKFSEGGISYLKFGMYPTSKVTDSSVLGGLGVFAGELPTATDSNGWTSQELPNEYGVNVKDKPDWSFFKDVKYEGKYYRAMYFTELRWYNPGSVTIAGQGMWGTVQNKRGYYAETVYWFEYEPIVWEVMSDWGGEMYLISKNIIDSNYWSYNGVKIANNYENSTIRTFLNDTFLYYAFTKAERELIFTNPWSNNSESTRDEGNKNACEDTFDKIAIPSMAELSNPALGFEDNMATPGKFGSDPARRRTCTNFAECQGLYIADSNNIAVANYWTRSPGQNPRTVLYVGGKEGVTDNTQIASCLMGVMPTMYVKSK